MRCPRAASRQSEVVLEATFDVHGGGDGCGHEATHAARIGAFLDRHGGRFVESRLAGRWVPAPR